MPAHTPYNNTPDLAALSAQSCISTLASYGVLEINGPDSHKFLQGQLTCNLQDIAPTQSRPGAHCTHKGRMIASFRLCQLDEQRYVFILPRETLPALQQSLGKYVVFSKAKLRDATEDYQLFGISGPAAPDWLSHTTSNTLDAAHSQLLHDGSLFVQTGATAPRYLWLMPAQHHQPASGENLLQAADEHLWHWLDICDGIGEVRAATREEFIPQMLNLQLLDGVSFSKGCYTGQEIVARMEYRGTLKKAMYRIGGSGVAPAPNTAIHPAGHADAQAVGHVVMAEAVTATHWEALAVIQHDCARQALCCEGSEDELQWLPLPYNLPTADVKA